MHTPNLQLSPPLVLSTPTTLCRLCQFPSPTYTILVLSIHAKVNCAVERPNSITTATTAKNNCTTHNSTFSLQHATYYYAHKRSSNFKYIVVKRMCACVCAFNLIYVLVFFALLRSKKLFAKSFIENFWVPIRSVQIVSMIIFMDSKCQKRAYVCVGRIKSSIKLLQNWFGNFCVFNWKILGILRIYLSHFPSLSCFSNVSRGLKAENCST